MILVEIRSPDGRMPRIKAETIDEVKANLLPGYEIVGRVYGADGSNNGGFVERRGEESLMAQLLEAYGDELMAYVNMRLVKQLEGRRAAERVAAEVYGEGDTVASPFIAPYELINVRSPI